MTTPHKWAAEIHAMADGKAVEGLIGNWYRATAAINPLTRPDLKWRIVPDKKVLRYRVAKMSDHKVFWLDTVYIQYNAELVQESEFFVEWLHDWQEVEVE